jgi:hypothetical protein
MFGDLPTSGWRYWAVWALVILMGVVGLLFYETLRFK